MYKLIDILIMNRSQLGYNKVIEYNLFPFLILFIISILLLLLAILMIINEEMCKFLIEVLIGPFYRI